MYKPLNRAEATTPFPCLCAVLDDPYSNMTCLVSPIILISFQYTRSFIGEKSILSPLSRSTAISLTALLLTQLRRTRLFLNSSSCFLRGSGWLLNSYRVLVYLTKPSEILTPPRLSCQTAYRYDLNHTVTGANIFLHL